MADRPKRTLCQPKRLVEEYCIPSSKRREKPVKDNNLYEIEVKEVDRERNLVRIHYKDYSVKFDEWRPYGSDDGYFPFIRQEKIQVMSKIPSMIERTISKINYTRKLRENCFLVNAMIQSCESKLTRLKMCLQR